MKANFLVLWSQYRIGNLFPSLFFNANDISYNTFVCTAFPSSFSTSQMFPMSLCYSFRASILFPDINFDSVYISKLNNKAPDPRQDLFTAYINRAPY